MFHHKNTILRHFVLFLAFHYCQSSLQEENENKGEAFIKSDELIPAYNVNREEYVEGSGDGKSDDSQPTHTKVENINVYKKDCDCPKQVDTTHPKSGTQKVPLVVKSTPTSVIVIIVVLSIVLLVCLSVIAYLLGRIKYLNMRQHAPVPDKAVDYDSDEYSVMMDWSEQPKIVKNSKYLKQ